MQRPWWMTALAGLCVAALLVNVPRDLLFAPTRDVEVWLGFEVRGPAALASAPLHWAIFAVGAWAFGTGRRWVVPWAAGYVFYVALSHLVWSEASPNGRGWPIGLLQAAALSGFGVLLLRARSDRGVAVRTLSRERARRVYDRIGRLQDSQAFYEDHATERMLRHGHFGTARRVFELGCGTGRLAQRLLSEQLPADASYRAVELSPVMVELARERLAPFGERARVDLGDGVAGLPGSADSCDRFVASYVLDLLSDDDIDSVLREAHRVLEPGGLLCLTGLSTGVGPVSSAVVRVWEAVHQLAPSLVGGCRPLDLRGRLDSSAWRIAYHARAVRFGIPSEVVVAECA